MPNLIQNLSSKFGGFPGNLPGGNPGKEVQDMNSSLLRAINAHIASPDSPSDAFVPLGFGNTWKSSYSLQGLPTEDLKSQADHLNDNIEPILADAISSLMTLLATTMLGAAPPIAIASEPIVASALTATGGTAALSTMTAASKAAQAVPAGGGLPGIPAIISAGIAALAPLVLKNPQNANKIKDLDFKLANAGLVGADKQRPAAWSAVNSQVLSIVPDPKMKGELAAKYWNAILLTINTAVPGAQSK